ncbi:MAG: FecR domain-containing protein [Candidatus Dojkabacteria bacterium]|nr:MAG: FecR domain-containing protein [Candidatus Dojkabacteria bacterium]
MKNRNSKTKFSVESFILQARISPSKYDQITDQKFSDMLWAKISQKAAKLLDGISVMSSFLPSIYPANSRLFYSGIVIAVALVGLTIFAVSKPGMIMTQSVKKQSYTGTISYLYGQTGTEADSKLLYSISDGATIKDGDSIQTEANSRASILFESGDIVRLDNNTSLKINKANSDTISLDLSHGQLYVRAADDRTYIEVNTEYGKYKSEKAVYTVVSNENEDGVLVLKDEVEAETKANKVKVEEVDEGYTYFIMNSPSSRYSLGLGILEQSFITGSDFISWNASQDSKVLGGSTKISEIAYLESPQIAMKTPYNSTVEGGTAVIEGQTSPKSTVVINGEESKVQQNGEFEKKVQVENGSNVIEIVATDSEGNSAIETVEVVSVVPQVPAIKTNAWAEGEGMRVAWSIIEGSGDGFDFWKLLYSRGSNLVLGSAITRDVQKTKGEYFIPIADGQTYNVRLCAYIKAENRCFAYSNIVSVASPTPMFTSSPFSVEVEANKVLWEYDGVTEEGFLVAWSTEEISDKLPRSQFRVKHVKSKSEGKARLEAFQGDGSYNVSICVKDGKTCSGVPEKIDVVLRDY